MSYFVVDIEADNKTPLSGNMVCFGAVKVEEPLDKTFYARVAPKNGINYFKTSAFEIAKLGIDESYPLLTPYEAMQQFADWIKEVNGKSMATFFSDNLAFDWMWIAYYFDLCDIDNPFGYGGRRIGDLFCGHYNNLFYKWKHKHRITKHTHNPVDDAKGNAEALLFILKEMKNENK